MVRNQTSIYHITIGSEPGFKMHKYRENKYENICKKVSIKFKLSFNLILISVNKRIKYKALKIALQKRLIKSNQLNHDVKIDQSNFYAKV